MFRDLYLSKKPQQRFKIRKKSTFSTFNVDHFSRLLQTQNTPKIFLGRTRRLVRSRMEGGWPAGARRKNDFFSLGSSHGPSPKFSVGASLAFARGFCPQGARIKLFFYKAVPVSLVSVSSLESIWPVSSIRNRIKVIGWTGWKRLKRPKSIEILRDFGNFGYLNRLGSLQPVGIFK